MSDVRVGDEVWRAAVGAISAATDERNMLYIALVKARETIALWHGPSDWESYQQSPEMRQINSAIAAIEGPKPSPTPPTKGGDDE